MAETYSVLFTGSLEPGADLEQAVCALSARFGIAPERLRSLIEAGGEVVLESGLMEDQAREHQRALQERGVVVRFVPAPGDGDDMRGGDGAVTSPASPLPASAGPYHPPRRVPMSHGWLWLQQGFSMVFASPVAWIGALLIWTVLNVILNAVPLVNLLSALLAPVLMGGLMAGARIQENSGRFQVESLFAGFSRKTGPLFLVGLLYMVGFIAIGLVMLLVAGSFLWLADQIPGPAREVASQVAATPFPWLGGLLVLGLTVGLMMTYWFAPALVMIDDIPPLRAMGLSFLACLRNLLPFVLYTVITLVLSFLAALPFLLGLLIVLPVIVASAYTAYRDIFRG